MERAHFTVESPVSAKSVLLIVLELNLLKSYTLVVMSGYQGCDDACLTETINFKSRSKEQVLPDHPENVKGATGGFVNGKFVCAGGKLIEEDSVTDKIYQIGSTDAVATMTEERNHAASCVVNNKLWNTGGSDKNGKDSKTTEMFDPKSGTVEPGPDLPVVSYAHSICFIESISTAMFIGGENNQYKTWFYKFGSGEQGWVPGPELDEPRFDPACGVIKDSEDESKTIVIVAGGFNFGLGGLKSTEILIIDSSSEEEWKWNEGNDLPMGFFNGAGVVTLDGKFSFG